MAAIGGYLEKEYLKECKRVHRTKLIVLGPLWAGKTYLFDHMIRMFLSPSFFFFSFLFNFRFLYYPSIH